MFKKLISTAETMGSETLGGEEISEPIFDITTDAHAENSDHEGEKSHLPFCR